jgi:two-component system chemotaxis response regulator CheY
MPNKVLIVDDSATVRMQVSRALRAAGFAPIEAADGILGLAAIEANPGLRLVVCDVNMPNMNGLEMLESLTPAQREVPIVMLTTEGQPELTAKAKALGARAWILKPFKPELFVAAVKKLTGAG